MLIWLCNLVFHTAMEPSNFRDSRNNLSKKSTSKRKQNHMAVFDVASDKKWNMHYMWKIINAACLLPSSILIRCIIFLTSLYRITLPEWMLLSFNYKDPEATRVTPQPGPRWPAARAPTRLQSFTTGLRVDEGVTRQGVLNQRGGPLSLLTGGRKSLVCKSTPVVCVHVCAPTVHSCATV